MYGGLPSVQTPDWRTRGWGERLPLNPCRQGPPLGRHPAIAGGIDGAHAIDLVKHARVGN